VSDVHLASKFFFDKDQKDKFWQFLEDVGNNPKARELILNGDIIETWSSPVEVNRRKKNTRKENLKLF